MEENNNFKESHQTLKILQSMAKQDDSIRILNCEGYLNFETYNYAKEILSRLFRSNLYKIIFNLENISYIASSGWAVFLGNLEVARQAGGDIKLAAMPQEVKFVFEALELENVINNYETVEDAINAFLKSNREI
ncbi:MAG: STAS domain-containing protein [Candidatus Goldbacteria bacterium]|nr:STAS domain-containing protein [Candidatus Goldiibacteriota bacterium]HPD19197.1 STAS domain-containing protein [Candidatus Goldiibacteriota bacterium]